MQEFSGFEAEKIFRTRWPPIGDEDLAADECGGSETEESGRCF